MPRAIDFHVHLPTTEFMQVTLGPYAKESSTNKMIKQFGA